MPEPAKSAVVFSGLLPHPPVVVPAVGGSRVEECRATLDACRRFAERLVARAPDRLLLASPHGPRRQDSFGIWRGERLGGHLGRFGAAGAAVDLPAADDLFAALRREVENETFPAAFSTWGIPAGEPLDHGSVVPLYFLQEAGWDGPTSVVSLPWTEDPEVFAAFGRAVARAAAAVGGRNAVVASGDMSHRVLPGAPAGHHPRAVEFDDALTGLIRDGELEEIPALDPELRDLAAEDAADTSILAAAAAGWDARGHEVLSYEHPFGVGYLVAVLHDADA